MPDNNNRVQFNEPKGRILHGPRQSWPTKMIIKFGLAKDAKQASIVLVVVAVLAIGIAVVFWPGGGGEPQPQDPLVSQ